jgi:hypothetical protein
VVRFGGSNCPCAVASAPHTCAAVTLIWNSATAAAISYWPRARRRDLFALDIGGVVLGEELDVRRVQPEPIMLLEGGQQLL